ncbi:RsfA family transcriptional regulator [Priestia filamentosa]|uniref:Transcriptional regulator n=1 Tax=Priestia filamentosa TaxID=1402861 RepID=A0A1X7G8Q1_9BACI|nr:RsfA family transcriptional regulator [Priestia filamentosa]AKO94827.1 transcriptional regulator [Priestia filamentosa]MDT3765162.1 RsfA family transcriptional regulator [Priestia filamentosa]MED3728113.1 RsfA family transcriptional regulator [Priestia filamentosa]OXS65703.1 RsfA family transcriptional regulator [Priestia filamentosa]RJS66051.1 RsfA family transcriptional regulator [Priestia filamentosa]
MKERQDAWTEENDLLLAETVLRHVREGSTQLNAFEEVGDELNRTSAACGFRWNAVVRHRYEKALSLAKKQRKQRQRVLGQEQGKKRLLYNPPVPTLEDISETVSTDTYQEYELMPYEQEDNQHEVEREMETKSIQQPISSPREEGSEIHEVIQFLRNLEGRQSNSQAYRAENERLKRENEQLTQENLMLKSKVAKLEQDTTTIQEDYETLMKIMNRARQFVLFEDDDRQATKFKMDRNGNLEKMAE